MKQNINWGIIGLGNIAFKFAEAFKNVNNAKLVAISSRNIKKLENFQQSFKIQSKNCFKEYQNLLNCERVDAVYIALPNSLHYEWIVKCIEKEKSVLVEKPAVLNSFEIEKIKEKLLDNKFFFAEGFMYRHHPQVLKMIEIINKKEIGNLISMESSFGINLLTKKNIFGFKKIKKINETSRIYNKKLGGGAILDLGCYPTSISILIASLIKNIDHKKINILNKIKQIGSSEVDIDSSAEILFDNNFKSYVEASFTKNLGTKTKIIGDKGELILENSWNANLGVIKIKKKKEYSINVSSKNNIFSHQIENISSSIMKNKIEAEYPSMSLADTVLNTKILDEWLNNEK